MTATIPDQKPTPPVQKAPSNKVTPKPGIVIPPKQAPVSRLGQVLSGRLAAPPRITIYGAEGIGKSTTAANAPNPIWCDADDGTVNLDVTRYKFRDEEGGHVPHSYEEINAMIADLTANAHPFKTLVLDTIDRIESMLHHWMLERDSKPGPMNKGGDKLISIESYGFGKGPIIALEEWRAFCSRLDRLRYARGMTIIILAHQQIRLFKSPDSDDFDRYSLRIDPKAGGFLREWCDVTAFATFEDTAGKMKGERAAKGVSTGRRLMRFERTAAYDAKTRIALPAEIEIDSQDPWGPFAEALKEGSEADAPKIREWITAELVRLSDDELTATVTKYVDGAGDDTASLTRCLMKLRNRM
jgi:hypothetical protein